MKMIQKWGALAVGVLVLMSFSAADADLLLLDYFGYDYTAPLPRDFEFPGQQYIALADADNINPGAISTDPLNFEYTCALWSGTLSFADTVAGTYARYYYNNQDGIFHVYEDAIAGGTSRTYGINPPNDTAPSTFEDGTLILGAQFTNLTIIVNLSNQTASLNGTLSFYCGEDWGDLPCYEGWTFAGETNEIGIPEGFIWAVDGLVYVEETSTEETSWGKVKNLFR